MERSEIRRLLLVLLLGQLVSLTLAVASFTSSLLASLGVDTPLSQSFLCYASLGLVYGGFLLFRRRKLLVPWYWYVVLAFIDVQGNYLVIKAYQFSSITSVTLLDCWTIVWVIILTRIFLRTKYSPWQILAAVTCVIGLGLVLLSDAWADAGGGKNPLLGDALVIVGTLFYAFSNVGEEFCVKKKDLMEVLAMLGVFGAIVSICEIAIFEIKSLEAVKWSSTIILLFFSFATASFLFYTIVPLVLKMSGATIFNLSLLTSDMWAIIIRVFFYKQKVDWLYYLSFGVVTIGIIIYSLNETNSEPARAVEDGNMSFRYEPLNQENRPVGAEVLAN